MRCIQLIAFLLFLVPIPARADSYLALSVGTSFESHLFDIWSGNQSTARRDLTGHSTSKDLAVSIGFRDALAFGDHPVDLEFELFERRSAHFVAKGAEGAHPTSIITNSVMISAWTRLGGNDTLALQIGAGLGARHSSYRMTGPGIDIAATDRAPYAMLGLRLTRPVSDRVEMFADLRLHTRPPVRLKSGSGAFAGLLEHNSRGQTLRFGLRFDL